MFLARVKAHLEVEKLLIEDGFAGTDINVKNNDEWTALHVACKDGHLDLVQLLIGRGSSVNLKTAQGSSPLHIAQELFRTEVVRYLIRQWSRLVLEESLETRKASWY